MPPAWLRMSGGHSHLLMVRGLGAGKGARKTEDALPPPMLAVPGPATYPRFRGETEMATTVAEAAPRRPKISLAPDLLDRILALAALVLLGAVLTALVKGRAEWGEVPPFVWAHIATILIAVTLTPVMLLRRRGDRLHRRLGWVWASAMALTATFSFGIRGLNGASLSFIHILSAWTLIQVPLIVWFARRHEHRGHRNAVRGMVIGALLIAGMFTFPFDRMLGDWLFG